MISGIGIRPIIFSVNCYIATILTMFIAFCLDLKSPGWAMTTVYLTSQPLSGVLRAKAVYRTVGTFIGGAAMVAIVPKSSRRARTHDARDHSLGGVGYASEFGRNNS